VHENGCGYEAQLESWYRFLIDPYPYRGLARVQCPNSSGASAACVQPETDAAGRIVLDEALLAQRSAFLRPDSLVAVIMLSDENDCSIQVGGRSWLVSAISNGTPMFRGSASCDTDPNAKCCYTCGGNPPTGCAADPICAGDPANGVPERRLPNDQDGSNLRCFDQKRRFGIDLLYPTARYVNALSQRTLCWDAPDLALEGCPDDHRVQNPLFSGGRGDSLVFLGGIVGVPWQALSADVDANGRALRDPTTELRYKTAAELSKDATWAAILGSPGVPWSAASNGRAEVIGSPRVAPTNPLMVESEFARPGVASGNAINGREYDTAAGQTAAGTPQDLEYACIFPLPQPIDCSKPDAALSTTCDCRQGDFDRPLCEQKPGVSAPGTLQYWSKAYPGQRELQVLHDYGDNSIVASICARNVDEPAAADFGYRPAIAAIVDRLKEQLGNRCLPRSLLAKPSGDVSCSLVEAQLRHEGACDCDPESARKAPSAALAQQIRSQLSRDRGAPCGDDDPSCSRVCLCEVQQVQDVAGVDPEQVLEACRNDADVSGIEGWCYVADTPEQKIGNPELVKDCRPTERRLLRFAGRGLGANTSTFVACSGAPLSSGS
jgi:hypothetical protein